MRRHRDPMSDDPNVWEEADDMVDLQRSLEILRQLEEDELVTSVNWRALRLAYRRQEGGGDAD